MLLLVVSTEKEEDSPNFLAKRVFVCESRPRLSIPKPVAMFLFLRPSSSSSSSSSSNLAYFFGQVSRREGERRPITMHRGENPSFILLLLLPFPFFPWQIINVIGGGRASPSSLLSPLRFPSRFACGKEKLSYFPDSFLLGLTSWLENGEWARERGAIIAFLVWVARRTFQHASILST